MLHKNQENILNNGQKKVIQVKFQIKKAVSYGKAIFVCGSLPPLGSWQPLSSLRMNWREGHTWEASVVLEKEFVYSLSTIQFKFLISDWNITSNSVQWESGCTNRKLNISNILDSTEYRAEWNMNNIIIFLKTDDEDEMENYYILGNLDALGLWKQKKPMARIKNGSKHLFLDILANNPQFTDQITMNKICMYSFAIPRDIQYFNYYYICLGETIQSEVYPGREYRFKSTSKFENNRLKQLDWQEYKIIVDQCCFDKMILQRLTNQIYFASQLKILNHIHKILDKKITAVLIISYKDEYYGISNSHLKALCKEYNLKTEGLIFSNVESDCFKDEVRDVVTMVQNLIIAGHRVCLIISNKLMKLTPLSLLYLTLFVGHSFGKAVQKLQKNPYFTQKCCKIGRQVYNYIIGRMTRGCVPYQQKN